MKKLLPFVLFIIVTSSFSQTQIGQDIDGEFTFDQFGHAVSISSNGLIVAVGAFENPGNSSNSGHVRVFENIGGTWTQIGQDINGLGPDDYSGFSVSLSSDGSIVAIGAPGATSVKPGYVIVYNNINGVWTQIGQVLNGEANGDRFGERTSLSSDGNVLAVGSRWNDGSGPNLSGHVRIFENIGGTWTQVGEDINGESSGDTSGSSVSLSSDGSIVAIGAPLNNGNGVNSGHVRVFENNGGTWTQIGQDIDGEASTDGSSVGLSISSDGSIVAIGASSNDGNGPSSGHVRIYKIINDVWTQLGVDIDGEAPNDGFGFNVSLSSDGSAVAIGGPLNDGINGMDSGHVRVYDLSSLLSIEESIMTKIDLFPNPAQNQFTVELPEELELIKVSISNQLGQYISSMNTNSMNIENLSKGVYFVEIVTDKGESIKKLLIN